MPFLDQVVEGQPVHHSVIDRAHRKTKQDGRSSSARDLCGVEVVHQTRQCPVEVLNTAPTFVFVLTNHNASLQTHFQPANLQTAHSEATTYRQ